MKQFLKIYIWQFISILFNFAAIFIVTPYLSSNQAIYGIYTLIVAAYLFLSYADFGFLGAGMKFASEYFAAKDLKQEIKIIGFTGYVFMIFVSVYALGIFYISFHPEILVKSLSNFQEREIARNLLVILSIFCPVFAMQRIVQIIFAVRLKDYIFQRVLIFFNAVKIIFATILFNYYSYPIVCYFLFSQICTLTAVLAGFYIVNKRFGYEYVSLFKSFRFSKEVFDKSKKIALASLFLTFSWILFYELDPFVISKLLGAKQLAIFAIGFTLMEYFRSVFGIIFSPFTAKFNHFIGLKDYKGLNTFFYKIVLFALPLTVFPVLSISITIKNFIFCWVGNKYIDSVPIAQVMVLSFLFSFLSSPSGILVMAYERAKLLYITNSLLPAVYWLGIFFTFRISGLQAFANFRVASFFLVAIVYLNITSKILELKFWPYLTKLFLPALLPILFIISITYSTRNYLPIDKNNLNLLFYFIYNGLIILIALVIYTFTSFEFRDGIFTIFRSYLNNYTKSSAV